VLEAFPEVAGESRKKRPEPPQTALCRALAGRGVRLEVYRLADVPGSPAVGHTARLRTCELAFRLEDSGQLLLIYFRRLERSRSLRNPFADLVGFLLLATRPEFGVGRVMGQIHTEPHPDGDGLSDGRLTRFYERFFRTRRTHYDHGEWLYSDIEPLRRRLAEVSHQAAPLGSATALDTPPSRKYDPSSLPSVQEQSHQPTTEVTQKK